jgi:hypothetical protein
MPEIIHYYDEDKHLYKDTIREILDYDLAKLERSFKMCRKVCDHSELCECKEIYEGLLEMIPTEIEIKIADNMEKYGRPYKNLTLN